MIIVLIELKIEKNNFENYIEAYDFLNKKGYEKSGRTYFQTYFSKNSNNPLNFKNNIFQVLHYEEWAAREKYEKYLTTESFSAILSLFELSIVEPNFKIFECDPVRSFSWIKKIVSKGVYNIEHLE